MLRLRFMELMTYTAASAAALALDVAVLSALVSVFHWHATSASFASFVAGGVLLYVLSVKFVFAHRRIPNPAIELPVFLALGTIGLALNFAVIYVGVDLLHFHYLFAKGCAAGCTFVTNFVLRRTVMFSTLAANRTNPGAC